MGKVITLLKLLPKKHQIILSALVIITVSTLILPSGDSQASKQSNEQLSGSLQLDYGRDKIATEQNAQQRLQQPLAFRTPTPPSSSIKKPIIETAPKHNETVSVDKFTVKRGDTLAAVFNRAGLTSRDVYEITQLSEAKKNLLKLIPGEQLSIAKNQDGKLTLLTYHLNPITRLEISHDGEQYQEQLISKEVESRTHFASATIESNFWNAGVDAGITPNQIMQLASIFGWDIDFALDLRRGDRFSLLYEQQYADGEFIKNGHILAADFYSQGERFTAVRYKDGNYYSHEGRSMRKAFLRSPVDFKYVSSSFNPKRLHPVTGQVKAHRGVDYVAKTGTPIKAAGKGRVIKSSYNKYNGNYVVIKHNDTYTTKYLHLNKRKVKQGQSVKQGDIIGTLGATGRVTGAHLHYEFIVNGVHRNPRTVKLPKPQPIASAEKENFLIVSQNVMSQLSQYQSVAFMSTQEIASD